MSALATLLKVGNVVCVKRRDRSGGGRVGSFAKEGRKGQGMYRYGLAGRGQWSKSWGVVTVFLIKCAMLL